MSKYLGQENWLSGITEYNTDGKQVTTTTMGGISHVAFNVGPLSGGLVGSAGVAIGGTSGSNGALGAQYFTNIHIYKSFSLILTVRKTWAIAESCPPAMQNTSLCKPAIRFTLGPGFAK